MDEKLLSTIEDKEFRQDVREAFQVLRDLNVPYGKIVKFEISGRMTRALGKTVQIMTKERKGKIVKLKYPEFVIKFAAKLLDPDFPRNVRKEVIFHEILHTTPDQFNHGPKWQQTVQKVSDATGLNISTYLDSNRLPEHLQKTTTYHYGVCCTECDWHTLYQRICKPVTQYWNYRCPRCKGTVYGFELPEPLTCHAGHKDFDPKAYEKFLEVCKDSKVYRKAELELDRLLLGITH